MFFFFFYIYIFFFFFFFFSSRRRHTRLQGDWSSDVCSSDLARRPAESRVSRLEPAHQAKLEAMRQQRMAGIDAHPVVEATAEVRLQVEREALFAGTFVDPRRDEWMAALALRRVKA